MSRFLLILQRRKPAYLTKMSVYRDDPHFARAQTFSMMHNPHPAYSIVLAEADPAKWSYYCRVLGFDPVGGFDLFSNPESQTGHDIDLTHIMLKTSQFIGTVSRAMRQRILDEPWLFGHAPNNYVERVLQAAATEGVVRMPVDQLESPTYTGHLAEAISNLIATGAYGVYNITGLGACTRAGFAQYVRSRIVG